MGMDKTIQRLGQRHNNRPGGVRGKERTPGSLNRNKVERARQSLHFANQSFKDLDDAYRQAAHDVYPQRLNKANFVEALVAVGIQHINEVVSLALEQQGEEEEE